MVKITIPSTLGPQVQYLSLYSRHAGLQAQLAHEITLMVLSYALISNIQGRMNAAFKVTGSISLSQQHMINDKHTVDGPCHTS